MAKTQGQSRHHARRHHLRGHGYFKLLGPGLVTGAADDDPSGIGTYSQVGAAFGFGLLWTALVSLPLAIAVQETSARLGLVTDRGLSELIRERFPKPVLWLAVVLVTVANTFNIGADLGSMAAALRLLVPIPFWAAIAGMTAVMLLLEVFVEYRRYSKVLLWLALSLVAYIGVVAIVRVDWPAVARATFLPQLRWDKSYIAALIAVFGTTISPYLFFWQTSEEVEEVKEKHIREPVDEGHVRAMRVDITSGMFSGVVVMFSIMVACAVTLGQHGITDIQTADQAAMALRPLAGNLAGLLFAAGIVGTGLLAVPVLAGSTGYALSELFGWHEGLSRTLKDARGFYGIIVVSMLVGFALNFVGLDPIRALYLAAILNGLAAPPLILLMLIVASSKKMMGRHASGPLSKAFMGLVFLLMAGLPVVYVLR